MKTAPKPEDADSHVRKMRVAKSSAERLEQSKVKGKTAKSGASAGGRRRRRSRLAPATEASEKLTTSQVIFDQVDDPFEPEKKLGVAKNIRVHPLDHMVHRGRITEGQKRAGDRFLAIYDRSQIGGARAIDYSRVKVDVSFSYDGLDEGGMRATDELKQICLHLGRRNYALLVRIIGHRRGVFDLARRSDGTVNRSEAEHLSRSTKEALDDLDDFFGVAEGRAKKVEPYVRKIGPHRGKIDLDDMGELTTPALRASK